MAYLPTFVKAAGLVSPASQQRTGSSTASSTHPDLDPQLDRGSVSPTNRTESWLRASSLKKDARTYDIHKVRGGKVAKAGGPARRKKRESFWGLPLLFGIFGKGQDDKGSERGLDGDTLIRDGDVSTMAGTDNDSTLVGDDDEDEVRLEKTERTLKDYSDRYLDYNDPRIKEWTSDEIWLFNKLAKRGAEPLLDAAWIMDYPTFPDQLFTNDRSQVYINNMHGPIYNACHYLTKLILAGSRVRDQVLTSNPPERPLFREITAYHKWSLADGNLKYKAHIPVVAIASAKPKESVESVVGRVTDQLHSLGRQYRNKWRSPNCREGDKHQEYVHELPTLIGFVIKYSIVAIVTCDSRVPGKPIRTLGTFDFKLVGQDVWHALAISIAMIKARNYLMQLDKEGELGEEIIEYGSDPDA